MIFLDSSFLIAFFLRTNSNYERASEIFESTIKDETFLISHHVLSEIITMVGRKIDSKASFEVYNFLIYSCKVHTESSKDYNKAINLFVQYDGDLSFVDCLNLAIMESRNISKIASFYDNFDMVKDIERIH